MTGMHELALLADLPFGGAFGLIMLLAFFIGVGTLMGRGKSGGYFGGSSGWFGGCGSCDGGGCGGGCGGD